VIRPVRSLARAAKNFRPEEDGTCSMEKVSQVNLQTGDEIGDLSRGIRTMQEQIVENTGNLAADAENHAEDAGRRNATPGQPLTPTSSLTA